MANISLSLPNISGNFTYAYRDTGNPFSAEQPMINGIGSPTETFVSPVCDELRITGIYPTAINLKRVHVAGLRVDDLTFALNVDSSITNYNQTTTLFPERKQHQNFRVDETGVSVALSIRNIGQKALNIDQIAFCDEVFTPGLKIQNTSSFYRINTVKEVRTRLGNVQTTDDSARRYVLDFLKLTNDEFNEMQYLVQTKSNNGFLLFELDSLSNDAHNAFLAYSSIQEVDPKHIDFISASANIKEAYSLS